MAGENRPNYFVLLGINPDDQWDQASFERRLHAKRSDWSRKILNGVKTSKAVMEARRALDLIPDMTMVMGDALGRDRERVTARAQLARDAATRNEGFEQTLQILLAKGFIYDNEYAKLRSDYPDLVKTPDVANRMARVPVRALVEEDILPERIDPAMAATIRSLLDSLGEKSLYTLLAQVDPAIDVSAERDELQRAARQLYNWAQSQADKHQPGLAAKQELAGHCMALFSSKQERARYDNTLALARVDDLLRRYQSVLAPVKRIDSGQVEQFLRDASNSGAEAAVARAMLLKHFGDQKWTVVLPAAEDGSALANLVRCWVCQGLNDPGDNFCQQCGARFKATCPSCQRTGLGHGSCGRCGFPVGDQDWVQVLIEDCEDLLRRQDLVGAGEMLKKIGRAWPLPATSTNELAVRHRQCAEQYEQLRGQRDEADREVSRRLLTLMEARQYLAAHRLATSAPATVPDRERILKESQEHIREADRQYDLAKRPGTSGPEKAAFYEKALARCADHEKSQQALRVLPPEPPEDLRVVVAGDVVRLRWQPSSTSDVRYVVVRKEGSLPASAVDGSRIATVTTLSYDDVAPQFGIPVHYAVFADRTGTVSEHCAATTDSVFLTGEVAITSRSVDDGVVVLEWTLPSHAYGVAIDRSSGLTPDDRESTEVVATEPTRLHDQGLRNGVTYTYTLRACYRDAQGATWTSNGTSVSLTPGAPPAAPGSVHVRTVDHTLGISYRHVDLVPEPAERGTVNVLWSQRQPAVRPGDRIDVADLARHGSLLTEATARGHALFSAGLYYFVPVTIQHELAYVGGFRRYAAVEEVSNLTATNHGGGIRLQWTWPEGCDIVLVAHGHTDWPADPTVARHQAMIEREDYERSGCYDVRVTGQADEREYFFLVATAVRRADEVFVSSGVRCRARLRERIRLEYKVISGRRNNQIHLRVSAPVQLPRLVIVGNPDRPPTHRQDGQTLHEQDALPVRRTHTITLPSQGKPVFAGLFLLGGNDDVEVEVVPPASPDHLRLR
jgi:hypothetical protein